MDSTRFAREAGPSVGELQAAVPPTPLAGRRPILHPATYLSPADVATEEHTRRMHERLALGVAGVFLLVAILPITASTDQLGVMVGALGFLAVVGLWFRVVPARAFGDHRVFIFTLLVQPMLLAMFLFSGGVGSVQLPYLLLPVLVTAYSAHQWHTPTVAAVTAASIVFVALLNRGGQPLVTVATWTANAVIATVVFAAFTTVLANGLHRARRAESRRGSDLARAERDARRLALTDALSGLYNRYHGDATLERMVALAERGQGFSVLAVDIDNMKAINDTHGHASGDAAIVGVAALLRQELRAVDVPIRTGGDEFVVLLPAASQSHAARVAGRLHQALADRNEDPLVQPFSISIGYAEWRLGMTASDLLEAADAALYQVKRELALHPH